MDKKILKIAAQHTDGSWYGTNEQELTKIMDEKTLSAEKDNNTIVSSWWYLHGDLQSAVGFDKGMFLNLGDFKTFEKKCYINGNEEYFDVICLEEGIYDVEIIGFDKPCVGYFWITDKDDIPMTRGLVCFKDDLDSVKDAETKFNKKQRWL